MKSKFKANNAVNHQENSKSIQISDLTELTDQEAEMVVGGWGSTDSDGGSGNGFDWGSTDSCGFSCSCWWSSNINSHVRRVRKKFRRR